MRIFLKINCMYQSYRMQILYIDSYAEIIWEWKIAAIHLPVKMKPLKKLSIAIVFHFYIEKLLYNSMN